LRVPQQDLPGRATISVRTRAGIAQREISVISKPLQELADGQITTISGGAPFLGDGRDARNAFLNTPLDVVADNAGNLFISDTVNHRVRRVDSVTGIITTVAGSDET